MKRLIGNVVMKTRTGVPTAIGVVIGLIAFGDLAGLAFGGLVGLCLDFIIGGAKKYLRFYFE